MPTLTEIANKIQKTLPQIEEAVANAEVLANNDALGAIGARIFNDGKKTNGTDIGNYQDPRYIQKRKNAGRQTSYVDLQFNGDLFNSVQVGQLNGKPAVGIVNEDRAKISDHLEDRFGVIFKASNKEMNDALDKARDYLFDELKNIIRQWS